MKKWIVRLLVLVIGLIAVCLVAVLLLYVYLNSKTNGELVSSGETRKYLLHVPEQYDAASPAALVISLHGAFLWPNSQLNFTRWNDLADTEGFIVVYPKASGFPPLWQMEPGAGFDKEVRFFSDLIDELAGRYNIDPARIYVNGFSNGAAMTIRLACALPDRIAAFGMVATPTVPWDWCENMRPAPIIVFNGTADPFVPYEGGENFLTIEPLLSMKAWLALWGRRNDCAVGPLETELASDLELTRYTECALGTEAQLYSLKGAGHIWPGGMEFPGNFTGAYSDSINASRQMWLFYQSHPLRSGQQ